MGKRQTFERNIKALTRRRSLPAAMQGWAVKSRISLKDTKQACELCGTRFLRGAMVTYPPKRQTIAVGGECLKHLLLGRFVGREDIHKRKTALRTELRQYEAVVHPSNWIKWVIEHAPPRLATAAFELEHVGAVSSGAALQQLIRFHDKTRLYPVEALIVDQPILTAVRPPKYMTILGASRWIHKQYRAGVLHDARQREGNRLVGQLSDIVHDRRLAGRHEAADLARRTVEALMYLAFHGTDAQAADLEGLALCWPLLKLPSYGSEFIWHGKKGLAWFCSADVPCWSADLLVFRDNNSARYSLATWRAITGASTGDVERLEELAYDAPAVMTVDALRAVAKPRQKRRGMHRQKVSRA